MRRGILAEFDSPEALTAATERLHALGLRRMEAYTPFAIPALERLLGVRRSRAPAVVLGGAILGGLGAYLLQWWINVYSYPLDVGGRPLHSAPAFIPITFELTVLCGSLAGFVACLAFCGLPRLWDPLSEVDGLQRAAVDRYWLGADGDDPRFAGEELSAELERLGARRVVRVGEAS